ncbi:MAG: tRNA 2-thiouridine(34) synthase MnmA [Chloroflexi bacterium]|nr:tRNA 2-thiouridine(34) synthase MnmA [Chloroflexota bacterium]
MNTPTVVVAMSGGVDSSTVAALLVERGYTVIGMMMRLWAESSPLLLFPNAVGSGTGAGVGDGGNNRCCSPEAVADARGVCQTLGIPFYLLNYEADFKTHVVDYFLDGYARGVTPNPCLQCNRQIKFGILLDKARAFGADFLATGHYARVRERDGMVELWRGVDPKKDQAYALSMLNQAQLAHVMFPLGEYTKDETRALARRFGLRVAEKHESQDLCFIADGEYRNFLRRNTPKGASALVPGEIVDTRGNVLGHHEGIALYTIGQRKGLGLALGEPLFVVALDVANRRVVVGRAEELGKRELIAEQMNWIAGEPPRAEIRVTAKIRYRAVDVPATVRSLAEMRAHVRFDEPLRDITPGQAVVLYDGDVCLGGGIIQSTNEPK